MMQAPQGATSATSVLLLCAASALVACSKAYDLEDTDGRKFHVACERLCSPSSKFTSPNAKSQPGGTSPAGAEASYAFQDTIRYLGICDAWVTRDETSSGATFGENNCRLVMCEEDANCPKTSNLRDPKCLSGLCANPAKKLDHADVKMLCLAGTGPWTKSKQQLKRADLAYKACDGDKCIVPQECRQP